MAAAEEIGDHMKVIIADDEEKVCQLIEHLVDWKTMGMEIAAVAHNGIEALEAIRKWQPDIVITDIRMPGYNGLDLIRQSKEILPNLEFIIISGYRHFEYAQTAIRYGVKDYLLKPIKKEELNNTLKRMYDAYMERNEKLSREELFRITMQNNLDRLRTGLFSDVLLQRRVDTEELSLSRINERFHYCFQEGSFQIVVIKIDGVDAKIANNQEFLKEKVLEVFNQKIREYCHDSEIALESYTCYAVLNYAPANGKSIRRVMKQILDQLLLQNDIFEQMRVTIGCGCVVSGLEEIRRSLKTAILTAEDRLIKGTNCVLEYEPGRAVTFAESEVFYNFNQKISTSFETMDEFGAAAAIDELKQHMLAMSEIRGHDILQMAKEIIHIYQFTLRKHKFPLQLPEGFVEDYVYAIDRMCSVDEIFAYAKKTVLGSFHEMIQMKMADDNRPVRIAKQYIRENYGKPITLESVSEVAGFNAAYFSTLFKKVTGVTFSEFLLETRMEAAKELLKETNLNIASICEMVGYSDSKHFTKTFMRENGLKPNQYRKLYS